MCKDEEYSCKIIKDFNSLIYQTKVPLFKISKKRSNFFFLVQQPPAIPPKFTVNLRPQTATDGEKVVLSCKVAGRPMPELSWFLNDKCIDNDTRFVINYNRQTGQCDCIIVECLPDDHGVFKCVARNPGGQAITTGMLAVKPKAGIHMDDTPVVPQQSQRVRSAPPQRPPQEVHTDG